MLSGTMPHNPVEFSDFYQQQYLNPNSQSFDKARHFCFSAMLRQKEVEETLRKKQSLKWIHE
jgi:hypothetical protein